MPPKEDDKKIVFDSWNNIELGLGQLYFKGLDESIEVPGSEGKDDVEWYDEEKPYIKLKQEPIELTLENVEYPRNWVLAECKTCGYKFPITELYAILLGSKGWTCSACAFEKQLKERRLVHEPVRFGHFGGIG